VVTKLLGNLAEVGAAEVKKAGVFTIPGLARIKTSAEQEGLSSCSRIAAGSPCRPRR